MFENKKRLRSSCQTEHVINKKTAASLIESEREKDAVMFESPLEMFKYLGLPMTCLNQNSQKISKKTSKKLKTSITTYERLTQDPVRKAKIEKEYKELLLSEILIAIMEEDHISVRKLAQATGLSPSIIQDIRSGKKENITLKSFSNIAAALGYGIRKVLK